MGTQSHRRDRSPGRALGLLAIPRPRRMAGRWSPWCPTWARAAVPCRATNWRDRSGARSRRSGIRRFLQRRASSRGSSGSIHLAAGSARDSRDRRRRPGSASLRLSHAGRGCRGDPGRSRDRPRGTGREIQAGSVRQRPPRRSRTRADQRGGAIIWRSAPCAGCSAS